MTNPFGALWRRAKIEWHYNPLLARLHKEPPPGEGGESISTFGHLAKGTASYGPHSKRPRRRLTDWRRPRPGPSGEWHARR
jgi:hypothetical protein